MHKIFLNTSIFQLREIKINYMLSRKKRQGKISLKSKTKEFANYNSRKRKKYSPIDKVSI